MLVFITHPKFFDKKSLYRKKPELVYIFNSKSLYDELSKKYKCVNLNKDYIVQNENFFPDGLQNDTFKNRLIEVKKNIYAYFKKKEHQLRRRQYVMVRGYKDTEYKLTMNFCDQMAKKDKNEATIYIGNEIIKKVISIIQFEKSESFIKQNFPLIQNLFNLSNSLYRSYIYSSYNIRGIEVFGDVFKYNFVLNVVLHYTFDKKDIYNNDFHFNYKKVLARLFIENIHKNDIKYFVKHNIEYYKGNEWL